MLVFDSIGQDRADVAHHIRMFLQQAWRERQGMHLRKLRGHQGDEYHMPHVLMKAPVQDNGCDCGVFLLCYAERFLQGGYRKVHSDEYDRWKLLNVAISGCCTLQDGVRRLRFSAKRHIVVRIGACVAKTGRDQAVREVLPQRVCMLSRTCLSCRRLIADLASKSHSK